MIECCSFVEDSTFQSLETVIEQLSLETFVLGQIKIEWCNRLNLEQQRQKPKIMLALRYLGVAQQAQEVISFHVYLQTQLACVP